MLRLVRIRLLTLAMISATAFACGNAGQDTPATASAAGLEATGVSIANAAKPASRGTSGSQALREQSSLAAAKPNQPVRKRKANRQRPLPAFSGWTLDREQLKISSLIGKRLLLFIFNPEVEDAPIAARAVARISSLRSMHNFEIVGVAVGSERSEVLSFASSHGADYRIIDDSSATITQKLGLRQPVMLLGIDSEGYISFSVQHFSTEAPDPVRATEDELRSALRLPPLPSNSQPVLGRRPPAPLFAVDIMDSDQRFELAAHRGEAVVLVFFLHTCPHCHETLRFMRQVLEELPQDKRPALIGIEITGRTAAVRHLLEDKGLDFFPVGFDDDNSMRNSYGVFGAVPDTFFIDAQGRIAARVKGWDAKRHEPLTRMRMAKLAGAPIPMLLRKTGFSGNEICGVCHESEHETWLFTRHAVAYNTLVEHGATTDDECVSCHVVGFGENGGFTSATETPELEGVGCETCHGRGGPHISEDFVQEGDYSEVCSTCHDTVHSLGFEFDSFLPRISHIANEHVAKLSVEERRKLLAELGAPRDVLPTDANYVGSESCESCHPSEYETWSASPHSRAIESLKKTGDASNAKCLACHVTAFGRPGGFATDTAATARADLARVGCESCHGPGGNHIEEGTPKLGNIVSLADKCDSCVILQICGSCHDEANDPGFTFEVIDKIEAQKHGTIEPGTGEAKQTGAHPFHELDIASAHHAFDRLEEQEPVWTRR